MVDFLTVYHNLSQLQNASRMVDIVGAANTATEGYLVLMFVIALFFVGVVTFKSKLPETLDAVMLSSLISFFLTGLLSLSGLISLWWALLWLFVLAISAAFAQLSRS